MVKEELSMIAGKLSLSYGKYMAAAIAALLSVKNLEPRTYKQLDNCSGAVMSSMAVWSNTFCPIVYFLLSTNENALQYRLNYRLITA